MGQTPQLQTPVAKPLHGKTARELMSPDPVPLRDSATIEEAVVFLTDSGYSAAPVIAHGRPVGVISRTDLVVHYRKRLAAARREREPAEAEDSAQVRDVMTPTIFSVTPETPAAEVVRRMVDLNVHRLFVVDAEGSLIGVISALDLLGRLCL